MSSLDSNKPFNNSVSEKQFNGFYIPAHNAKIIKDSIENGTATFLPDQNGNVNAKPIINGNTGYCLNAKDLIPMQVIQKDNSNIAVTYKTTQNLGTRIKEGEKGFFYNFQREDKTIGTSQFFFPEQTENPQLIKEKVSELKFSSNSAKKAFIADALKEEMKMKDGQLQGFDDFLESYKKTDADAFLKEDTANSDEDEPPKPQFSGKSSGTDTQPKGDVEKPSVTFW